MIPTVDDLKSSPLIHRFGDCFNPPGLTNFIGCVQSEIDVTGIRSLSFPPYSTSNVLTAGFGLDGVHFQSLGLPVTTFWYPDKIVRTAEWRDIHIESTTVLAVGRMAAIVGLRFENRGGESRSIDFGFNLRGCVNKATKGWHWLPPSENDNTVSVDSSRGVCVYASRHTAAVQVQGMTPKAGQVRAGVLRHSVTLAPGESAEFAYVNAIGASEREALALYDELASDPKGEIDNATADWNADLKALFTPDNDRYSGHLPEIETTDEDIRKLYWMGACGVAYFKRDSPHSVMGRTYDTLMPKYWQTVTFLWDYFLSSGVHAQLDPVVMKKYLEHWMHTDIYEHFGTEYLSGGPAGNWYSVNDFAMVSMVNEYVRWTGDRDWLSSNVKGAGTTVAEFVARYASKWKEFRTPNGLADYGGINNLLECVSTYVHEVASLNAANVHNMRVAASLLELAGRAGEAPALRKEAEALFEALQELYVDGKGFWNARYPDGSKVEVRHCYDLLTVLNTIPDDISPKQKAEMVAYFKDELMSETWMYALSPKDENVLFDVRPDHQWTGAYPAWPPETVRGLYRVGESGLAFRWLKGLAKSANQGPFGQAQFAETVVETEDGGARKAPPEFPYITDWHVSSSGSWVTAIQEGIFGLRVSPESGISAQPQFGAFDAEAELRNVTCQGRRYTATREGLKEDG